MKDNPKDGRALLDALREGRKEAIQRLYGDFFPGLSNFVRNNQGTLEDAKDLFQECLFYLYRYLNKTDREEIDNLPAYFRAMYRNRWYHHLNQKAKLDDAVKDYQEPVSEPDEMYYIYLLAFQKLGKDCRQVLKYYVEGKNSEELASYLNTSTDYAKRKKYLCKEQLKKIALELLKKDLTE